jgi:Winged helix DNA-binding domain
VPERVLPQRALNRALLARQLLLERADLTIPRALERLGGLQTQYAPSGYIGLWSRLTRFERDALTRALERRTVVQATVLRSTIHMVTPRDYLLFTAGIRESRRRWWSKAARQTGTAREMRALAKRLRAILADGPRTRAEIVELLGIDATTWNGLGLWIDLVRVPPSGTWERRRADLYALADDWIGPSEATEEEGLEHLVRRYLTGFAPAAPKEIANWAGVPAPALMQAIGGMKLRRFRSDDGAELVDLPRGPLPGPHTPAPVRFLPTWDATLLVHARRSQILPERHRPRVFNTRTPHSVPTFLVDGQVAGTWRFEKGAIRTEPFDRLTKQTRQALEHEAERLAAFHA